MLGFIQILGCLIFKGMRLHSVWEYALEQPTCWVLNSYENQMINLALKNGFQKLAHLSPERSLDYLEWEYFPRVELILFKLRKNTYKAPPFS